MGSTLVVPSQWSVATVATGSSTPGGSQIWGPRMWTIIDTEMTLKDCSIYCYAPDDDPYDGDEGAIWNLHYFFFNKTRKRVCYIYLRGLSVMSHSPARRSDFKKRAVTKRASSNGARKRARYWLGDRAEDVQDEWDGDDDDDVIHGWDDDEVDVDDEVIDDGDDMDYDYEVYEDNDFHYDSWEISKNQIRAVSEDIAEKMEV
jgi:hypothetical protein